MSLLAVAVALTAACVAVSIGAGVAVYRCGTALVDWRRGRRRDPLRAIGPLPYPDLGPDPDILENPRPRAR